MKTFDQLISDIINKQPLDMKLMADFFMLPGREERSSVNLKLGSAFGQAGDIDKATECLRRVWELGSGNFSIFYSYFQLLKHRGHYADAINLCREAAVCLERQLKAEDIMLIYQLRSSLGFSIDPGTYFDRIIYEVLNRLLNGRKLKIQLRHNIFISDKIKLGYFLWGEEADNSTLFKNNLMIGKHHNTEKFEVRFYSYFTEDRICASNKSAADMFHQMRMNRIKFVTINTGKRFIE